MNTVKAPQSSRKDVSTMGEEGTIICAKGHFYAKLYADHLWMDSHQKECICFKGNSTHILRTPLV